MDIEEFYPSISKELLKNTLNWAATITELSKEDEEIILHARKSLLFSLNNNVDSQEPSTWTKKDGLFDVTMGAPDGAEICELVGLFLLQQVKEQFPQLDFGLYRDDGLAAHDKMGGRTMQKTIEKLTDLFGKHGLRITVEPPNIKIVHFLDVTLNLEKNTFCPYRKPNDSTKYVNIRSNHPPTVLKEIPKSINKRLSKISSTEKEFNEAKEVYQQALKESGYEYELKYEKPDNQPKKKKRSKRDILWYNPPFNMAVKTKVGKKFLKLLETHFPKENKLHKILNRNTVKLSYSCMKNVKSIIQSHNAKIRNPEEKAAAKKCTCRNKAKCPLQNECNQKDVIYHATVEEGMRKKYVGCAQNFKKRYYGHTESFRNEANKNNTALSTHIWEQNLNPEPKITWTIVAKASSYNKGSRYCDLCLTEKLVIMKNFSDPEYLNKRTEMAQRCRHRQKFLLQAC